MAPSFAFINSTLQEAKATWSVEELFALLKDASPDIQNKLKQGFASLEAALQNFTTSNAEFDAQNSALQSENAALNDKIATLNAHIADLSLHRPLATAPTSAAASGRARQKEPNEFTGNHKGNESHKNQEEFRVWKKDLILKFEMDGHLYPTEREKIIYAAGRTAGTARKTIDAWVSATLENKPNGFSSWQQLVSVLERVYDVADRAAAAEREMARLEQKNQPFMVFFTKFNALLSDLNWNDEARVAALKSKINYEMSSALVPIVTLPATDKYDEWVTLLCRLAENLEAHSQRKPPGGTPANRSLAITTAATAQPVEYPTSPDSDPMILDAMRLTPQERLRRIQQQLCLYCGKPGHRKLNCPEAAAARTSQGRGRGRGQPYNRPQPAPGGRGQAFGQLQPAPNYGLRTLGWVETASAVSSEPHTLTPPSSVTPTDEQPKETSLA
jgi:hypothetical protein